jgi:hypothetical protein
MAMRGEFSERPPTPVLALDDRPDLARYRIQSPGSHPFEIAAALAAPAAGWFVFAMLGAFTISGAHEITKHHEGKLLGEREARHHQILREHYHLHSIFEAVP